MLGIHEAPIMTYKEKFNETSDEIVERSYALATFGEIGEIANQFGK